ncbi:MAG: DnaJ C-terminal domain-containing protein, partial [Oscillospiraceae bacterium]
HADILGRLFGGRGSSTNPNAPRRGNDIQSTANISFFEAAKGCKREIKINRNETCTDCNGSGAEKGTNPVNCAQCGGTGQVKTNQRTPFGVFQSTSQCPKCHGKGKIVTSPCKSCGGAGKKRVSKTIEVNIPAGIDNGQTIALRNQGDIGSNRGPSGDLNITVNVRPDSLFERDGFDVWCEIPISFMQASLGDEIIVPTIDGKVKYNIGEGTQPGTTFRLKGKGIPYLNSKGRGDQFVKVTVEVPKGLNKSQKSALKDFEKSLAGKNYEKTNSFAEKLKNFMGM